MYLKVYFSSFKSFLKKLSNSKKHKISFRNLWVEDFYSYSGNRVLIGIRIIDTFENRWAYQFIGFGFSVTIWFRIKN